MNWNLIWWFAGVMATIAGLRFVVIFFKELFSRETMEDIMDITGDKISDASHAVTNMIKKSAKKRKIKKMEREQEEKPIVLLR